LDSAGRIYCEQDTLARGELTLFLEDKPFFSHCPRDNTPKETTTTLTASQK
jgi:hypothetical protein